MIPSKHLFLLVLVLAAVDFAHAEIYKWVDADDGETNYSERDPGAGVNVETITPYTSGSPAARTTWQAQSEAYAKRRKEAQEQGEKDSEAAAEAARIEHNCEQAKLRVASMERPRINKVDADGTRTRMPEEWRQAQLLEAQAAVEKYCR